MTDLLIEFNHRMLSLAVPAEATIEPISVKLDATTLFRLIVSDRSHSAVPNLEVELIDEVSAIVRTDSSGSVFLLDDPTGRYKPVAGLGYSITRQSVARRESPT